MLWQYPDERGRYQALSSRTSGRAVVPRTIHLGDHTAADRDQHHVSDDDDNPAREEDVLPPLEVELLWLLPRPVVHHQPFHSSIIIVVTSSNHITCECVLLYSHFCNLLLDLALTYLTSSYMTMMTINLMMIINLLMILMTMMMMILMMMTMMTMMMMIR